MPVRAKLWRNWAKGLGCLLLLLAVAACTKPQPVVAMEQDMHLGRFTLRAVSVNAYSRAHQGVPWEVEVRFSLSGGNRFDRADFANEVSRAGVYFRTAAGWHDRTWLLRRGDAVDTLVLQANPPPSSGGYSVEIRNPYGEPSGFLIDLGK